MERFHLFDVLTAITGKAVTQRPYPESAIRDVLTWMKKPTNWPGDQAFALEPAQFAAVAAEAKAALMSTMPKLDWTIEEIDDAGELTEATFQAWRTIWGNRHGLLIELPKLPA